MISIDFVVIKKLVEKNIKYKIQSKINFRSMKSFTAKIQIIGVNPYVLLPASVLKTIFKPSSYKISSIPTAELGLRGRSQLCRPQRISAKTTLSTLSPVLRAR